MNDIFFIISKIAGLLIRPDTWIILLAALSLLAILRGAQRLGLTMLATLVFGTASLAILPLGQLVLSRIEAQYSPPESLVSLDGIVILGGGEDLAVSQRWGVVALGDGAERLTTALELARRFPDARLVYAGGSGRLRDAFGSDVSEAEIARRFFTAQGIAFERILMDTASRNTSENARNAQRLARAGPEETWVLVTSAFHMPRAMRSFEAVSWSNIMPYPVDYRTSSFQDGLGWSLTLNLEHLQIAIKEMVGSVAYHIADK